MPELDLRLMVVSDRSLSSNDMTAMLDALQGALDGGATAIMLREKDMSRSELLAFAMRLREMTHRANALFIVNHDLETARASGADGAHLGWRSPSVKYARAFLGDGAAIGVSTHSIEEAQAAREAGADYVTFGPVWPTPSKKGLVRVQGIEGLRDAAKAVDASVIALGGVDASNAGEAVKAGAAGVALIRGVLADRDPRGAARCIREAVDRAMRDPSIGRRPFGQEQ